MKTIRRLKYPLTIIIIIIFIVFIILTKNKLNINKYEDIIVDDAKIPEPMIKEVEKSLCTVDIKGAINSPGVYRMDCNKYVEDVIKEAGNLTEDADTSLINLAKKITDEMVIIIYTKEEVSNIDSTDGINKVIDNECICPKINNDSLIQEDVNDNILININTATLEELIKIPGIGESKARAIIAYRTNNGKFTTIEDIKKVSGIGDKLYEQIKIYITT